MAWKHRSVIGMAYSRQPQASKQSGINTSSGLAYGDPQAGQVEYPVDVVEGRGG